MELRTTARVMRRGGLLLGAFVLLLAAGSAQAATCPFVAGQTYTGSFIGASCKNTNLAPIDLSSADLTNANFQNAVISSIGSSSVLTGANLSNATIQNADFTNATLDGANLTGANAQGAIFDGASLVGVDFTGANLKSASFSGANLAGANLSGVSFNGGTGWSGGIYNSSTIFPAGFNPASYGMVLPEPKVAMLLLVAAALFILPRLDRRA